MNLFLHSSLYGFFYSIADCAGVCKKQMGKSCLCVWYRICDNLLFPGDNVEKNSKPMKIQRIAGISGE